CDEVWQHLGQVVEVARVGHRASEAHAGFEPRASVQPCLDSDVDSVVDLTLLAVVRMLSHDVVDATECGRFDVVEPTDLIPAATWQPLVTWNGDAVRVVICRGYRLIVRDQEIAVPRSEVARVERDIAPQFVLHL